MGAAEVVSNNNALFGVMRGSFELLKLECKRQRKGCGWTFKWTGKGRSDIPIGFYFGLNKPPCFVKSRTYGTWTRSHSSQFNVVQNRKIKSVSTKVCSECVTAGIVTNLTKRKPKVWSGIRYGDMRLAKIRKKWMRFWEKRKRNFETEC